MPLSGSTPSHATNSYDFFKGKLLHRTLPVVDYKLKDNLLTHFLASCLAGTVATSMRPILLLADIIRLTHTPLAVCSPADVLRSRVMAMVSHVGYYSPNLSS